MPKLTLKRQEVISIAVYEQDTKRCSPECPYIYKEDGQYQCGRYHECVDGGFEDTDDMYGFKRSIKCLEHFGIEKQEPKPGMMQVCFNGMRSNLAEAFNEVVEVATEKDWAGDIDIDHDRLFKKLAELRGFIWGLLACHEDGDPECRDLSDEVELARLPGDDEEEDDE